jgi:hypothetical protein
MLRIIHIMLIEKMKKCSVEIERRRDSGVLTNFFVWFGDFREGVGDRVSQHMGLFSDLQNYFFSLWMDGPFPNI